MVEIVELSRNHQVTLRMTYVIKQNLLTITGKIKRINMILYRQTSVYKHNSFWKAVRKPNCLKTESYFPIINNVKKINLFHAPKE